MSSENNVPENYIEEDLEMDLTYQTIEANNKILSYVLGSMAIGIIPVPLIDLLALSSLQVKMLHSISKIFHVEFKKEWGKSAISGLIGGAVSVTSGMPIAASLGKFVPILGQAVATTTMVVLNGAITYAIGKVFVQHFASGGTFLTFDPEAVRDYFAEQVRQGRIIVTNVQKGQKLD